MSPRIPDPDTAARMRATAAALATAGLDATVHSTRRVLVITASLHWPGRRPVALLLGVPPASPAAWLLPGIYAAVAVAGLCWGLILKLHRPQVYAAIGLGAYAITATPAPARQG